MKTLHLSIYDINVKISSNSEFALENLEKDFMLYLDKKERKHTNKVLKINIYKGVIPYQMVPSLEASLYSLGSICYRDGDIHYVDYSGKGLMVYDFTDEIADIYSEDEKLLYEKARLAVLSRIGELLDSRHVHRIHAVGFAKDTKATICLLPMEGGKTTLALNVLRNSSEIKLLSDDVCFIDFKNCIYPFALRIGTRDEAFIRGIQEKFITKINRSLYGEKFLIDLAYLSDNIAEKSKVRNILIGKRVFQERTEIKRLSKIKCLIPFIQSGVFGLGLPQIVELFLRGGFLDTFKKTGIALSRACIFLKLILQTDTYELKMGRDLDISAEVVADFINSR